MLYNPGLIHESFQKSYFYEIGFDFTISHLRNGFTYSDLKEINYWDIKMEHLNIDKGDVIEIKWFKVGDAQVYSYLESVIKPNGDILKINRDTIISLEFIEHNSKDSGLFTNVSKIYRRDEKINQILN